MSAPRQAPVGTSIAIEVSARDGPHEIRTGDFDGVCRTLGIDVLAAFCACFVHADRLQSLIAMYVAVIGEDQIRKGFKKGTTAPVPVLRNYMTAVALVTATLKELSLELGRLNNALVLAALWDEDDWGPVKKWITWGTGAIPSDIRNKFAFHLDPEWIKAGLTKIRRRSKRKTKGKKKATIILKSSSNKVNDSWFELGHEALVGGGRVKDLSKILKGMIGIHEELEKLLYKTLERAGLKPVGVVLR